MSLVAIIQIILIKIDAPPNNDIFLSFQDVISEYSMGAYTQSQSVCNINQLELNDMQISCPGELVIQKRFSLGVVSTDSFVCKIENNTRIKDPERVLKCNQKLD